MSATLVSQARVIMIFAGVAVEAPAGAAMKMRRYKTPATLALKRSDASRIRSIVAPVLKLVPQVTQARFVRPAEPLLSVRG